MFAIGAENAMESGEIHPGYGHQCGEPGDEVERDQYDVRGAVAVRGFELDLSVRVWPFAAA